MDATVYLGSAPHLPVLTNVSQPLCNVVEDAWRVESEGESASYSTL